MSQRIMPGALFIYSAITPFIFLQINYYCSAKMKLKGIVTKPPLIALLTDLAAAIAAGLSAGLVTAFISAQSERKVNSLAQTKIILLALVSYLVIALLLHWFWTGAFRRIAPNCILIGILGSLLFVTIRLTPGIIDGWNAPSLREKPPLSEYISTEISAALSLIIFLSIVTLPVAAIVTYLGNIFKAGKSE